MNSKSKKTKCIKRLLDSVNKELSNHIMSIKLIPNPKYMVEPNHREMIWTEEDEELQNTLTSLKKYLEEIQSGIEMNNT